MAAPALLQKTYELGGLDLRSQPIEQDRSKASYSRNHRRRRSGAGTNRKGTKASVANSGNGGFGLIRYGEISPTTGAVTVRKLLAGSTLREIKEGTFTVSYTGSGSSITASCSLDTSNLVWKFTLTEDGVEKLSEDLGVGFDEATPYTLANLKTAIDALTDFSATIVGDTSTPAAFLPALSEEPISTSLGINYTYQEAVNTPTGPSDDLLEGSLTNRNSSEFENVSWVNINGCAYIGNGYNEQTKFDGVDHYRSGMPEGVTPGLASAGSGSISAGTRQYIVTYSQKDAQTNIVEGIESLPESITLGSSLDVTVTLTNILKTTGFNTDCAIVAGAQSGVTTITVDDGSGGSHTMKVGQTAYLYDGVSSSYVEREITAVAAGTITIDGAAVNVADNAVISNNLRINVYRTLDSGTKFYLLAELPNNSFTATQTYTDSTTDTTLDDRTYYTFPLVPHGLPPKGKALSTYRGLLLVGGSLEFPNILFWSDINSPEYFPPLSNSQEVQTVEVDRIIGFAPEEEFFLVFKKNSTFRIVGDLTFNQYRVDLVSPVTGCSSQHSISQIQGAVVWLYKKGVFVSEGGGAPRELSIPILPLFTKKESMSDMVLRLERSVAVHDPDNELYLLYIPTETTTGGEVSANTNSIVIVYDYFWQEFHLWIGLNMAGGAIFDEDNIFFVERRYTTFDSTVKYNVYSFNSTDTEQDFADHISEISWEWASGHDSLGEPSVYKKANRMKVYSDDPELVTSFDVDVQVEKDFSSTVSSDFSLSFGSSGTSGGFAIGAWGVAAWGAPSTRSKRMKLKSDKIQAARTRFKNDRFHQQVLISAYEIDYRTSYKPELKQ